MLEKNLVSIVIPCYNVEKYIQKTVESVLLQTHKKIELILVDDGSSDGTSAILDELANQDSRIKVIHQGNGGVTSARFAGIDVADGEWIGFVDGDDVIEPDMYEKLLKNAVEYNADISHCGYQMIYPSRVDYYYNTGRLIVQDNKTGLIDLLDGSFIEPGLCNKLYNHSLLQELIFSNKMDFSVRNNEDLLMNYYLFKNSRKSVFEDICPYHYILRPNSATSQKISTYKLLDPLRVLKIIKSDVTDNELTEIINSRITAQLISLSTINCDYDREKYGRIIKDARRELKVIQPEISRGNYSIKTKVKTVWCASSPWSYGFVHRIYAKIKGTSNKYEIK